MIPFLLAINSHAAARGEGLHTEFTRHYAQLLRMAGRRAETQRFVKAPKPAQRQTPDAVIATRSSNRSSLGNSSKRPGRFCWNCLKIRRQPAPLSR